MNYKSYANKKDTPARMTRKQARRVTFLANARAKKAQRKGERIARKEADEQ